MSEPGRARADARARFGHVASYAGPTIFVLIVLVFGIFRTGGLLPRDRSLLVVMVLAWSVLWAATVFLGRMVVGRRRVWTGSWPGFRVSLKTLPVTALGLLGVWALSSALWSAYPARSVWAALVVIGGVTAAVAGGRLWLQSVGGVPLLVVMLAIVGAAVSWASLVGSGLGWDGYVGVLEGVGHAQGPFGYANALASLVVLTLPGTVWLGLMPGAATSVRLLAGGSVALQVWTVTLTHSRGAVAAIAGACALVAVVLVYRSIRSVRSGSSRLGLTAGLAVVLTVALTAVSIVAWRYAEPYVLGGDVRPVAAVGVASERVEASAIRPMTTDGYRLKTWAAAIEATRARPVLGYGADTFYEAYSPYKPGAKTRFAHNLVIQHGVELGSVGVFILAVALAGVVGLCVKALMVSRLRRDPAPWVCVSVLGFLVQNMVDLVWFVPALFLLFWLCVGAVAEVSSGPGGGTGYGSAERFASGGGAASK